MVKDRTRQPPPSPKTRSARWPLPAIGLLAGLGYLIYTAVVIDPRFIYNTAGLITNFPCFYYGWQPFLEHISRPGGTLEYITAFLAQAYYDRWLGAAVITAAACLAWLSSCWYLGRIGLSNARIAATAGPILILALHSQYLYALDMVVGSTAAIGITLGLMRLAYGNAYWRTCLACLLLALAYWATGGASLLVAVLLAIAAMASGLTWSAVAVSAWAAICPYLIGVLAYGDSIATAYSRLTPWQHPAGQIKGVPALLPWLLYLALPLGAIAAMVIKIAIADRRIRRSPTGYLEALVACIAMVCAAWWSYDPRLRALFAVDYYSQTRDWKKVIDIARAVPYNYLICHAANRALFHTSQLGHSMFSLPQDPASLLLSDRPAFWHKARTCMELGLINEAENALCIAIEIYGERPILIDGLATVNIVKGNPNAARVLLGTLARVPFWACKARQRLNQLALDPNLSTDPFIQQLRERMLRRDWVRPTEPLPRLLEQYPANRMAYEYLMAQFLLTKDLAGLVRTFNQYHWINMDRTPRHYQEALLLAKALDIGSAGMKGYTIETGISETFVSFMRTLASFGSDLDRARRQMKDRFGDTYFYYFYLGG